MAHTGKFKLDGKEADLIDLAYSFDRGTTDKGKPSTLIRKCEIIVKIASDDGLKNSAVEWLAEGNGSKKGKKGSIVIHDEEGKDFKKIEFENGFLVKYKETYQYGDTQNVVEEFTISPEKVNIGSAKFDFKWPKS